MSKGLEALKELKECLELEGALDYINKERTNIIEQELKEYEELKDYEETKQDLEQVMKDYQDLGQVAYKYKQALEIIKDKKVCVESIIVSPDLYSYNRGCVCEFYLTQEEYELLKSVL